MMIKAIILIQLWSLIVAIGAWAMLREKAEELGQRFPPPAIWLVLIVLCLLPGALSLFSVNIPARPPLFDTLQNLPAAAVLEPAQGSLRFNYLAIYLGAALILMSRTLFSWLTLQRLKLAPSGEPYVFTTSQDVPPLSLSWPRRAIVIPELLEMSKEADDQATAEFSRAALIRHERAHLAYYDAELTLGLLLLRDFMLRTPAISYLVRQWRLAIELRADRAATEMLTTSERKSYAELLLNGLRPCGEHRDGRTLPCPTAHLTSTRHRSVKMRLVKIMETKPRLRKRRWYAAVPLMTAAACALGFMNTNALAKDERVTITADKIIYAKRVPPKMPSQCSGLDPNSITIEGKTINLNGKSTYLHSALVGTVVLKYDVYPDGRTHNLRIVKSSHACFEAEAKASVAQWMIEPQGENIRDVAVMLKFLLTGETHEELEPQLNTLLK